VEFLNVGVTERNFVGQPKALNSPHRPPNPMPDRRKGSVRQNQSKDGSSSLRKAFAEMQTPKESKGIAEERLDFSDMIERIKHFLRGERKHKGEWVEMRDKVMNPDGVQIVEMLMEGMKNVVLSQMSNREIQREARYFHKKLALILGIFHSDFNLDKKHMDPVHEMIIRNVKAAMKRAQGGAESEAVSSTVQRVEKAVEKEKDRSSWIPFMGGS